MKLSIVKGKIGTFKKFTEKEPMIVSEVDLIEEIHLNNKVNNRTINENLFFNVLLKTNQTF